MCAKKCKGTKPLLACPTPGSLCAPPAHTDTRVTSRFTPHRDSPHPALHPRNLVHGTATQDGQNPWGDTDQHITLSV